MHKNKAVQVKEEAKDNKDHRSPRWTCLMSPNNQQPDLLLIAEEKPEEAKQQSVINLGREESEGIPNVLQMKSVITIVKDCV